MYYGTFADPDQDGACRPSKREITIRRGLSDRHFAETLLHECLHAQDWRADEDIVEQSAKELLEALEETGVL